MRVKVMTNFNLEDMKDYTWPVHYYTMSIFLENDVWERMREDL
jgi:hypothetical protein